MWLKSGSEFLSFSSNVEWLQNKKFPIQKSTTYWPRANPFPPKNVFPVKSLLKHCYTCCIWSHYRAFSGRRYQWWSLFALSSLDRWITLPTENYCPATFGPSLEKLAIRSINHYWWLQIRRFLHRFTSSIVFKHILRSTLVVIFMISKS